jgi:N-acetyl-anhydromuramyl-L-alanine amidase AmpD
MAAMACASTPNPGDPLPRRGEEISVCGRLFATGTRVVLWNDPGGYDAYRLQRRFEPEKTAPRDAPERIARYGSYRRGLPESLAERVREHGWTLEDLRSVVRQIVVHYDAAGSARRCFEILHDLRGLSSHFLLDVDGTVYQTLDLKERAWHAGKANDRSVGIEIANVGAYRDREEMEGLRERFQPDAVPARPGPIRGRIQGGELWQHDLTDAQYEALGKLVAVLCRVLDVRPEVPRDEEGGVRTTALPEEEALAFPGIVGHLHVSKSKVDPGPAFDWDRLLRDLARHGAR